MGKVCVKVGLVIATKKEKEFIRVVHMVSEHSGQYEASEEAEGFIKAKDLFNLIEQQSYRCALSGVELTPSTCAVDHIIPITKGGKETIENIQIVHRVINRMKGTLSMDEFKQWCSLVAQQEHV